MKIKSLATIAVILCLVLVLVACGAPTPAPTPTPAPAPATAPTAKPAPAKPAWPEKLTYIATPSGTPGYQVAVAWVTLVGKYAPEVPRITVEPGVGMAIAVKTFLSGRADITITSANVLPVQLPEFIGGKTLASGPQALITSPGSSVHILTLASSSIRSVADFRGKKILAKVVGGPEVDMTRQAILAAYGMTDADIILLGGNSNAHNVEQLREGVGDAGLIFTGVPGTNIVELCTMKDVRFIPLPQDKLEALAANLGVVAGTIPAGTYPKQTETIPALRMPLSMAVTPGMDIELAYTLVKVLYDHWDEFIGMFPLGTAYSREHTLDSFFHPFHPGAIKYYKEKGMWTKEMDAMQQKLLNTVVPAAPAKPQ